jgi:hypothetical protein
VRVAMNTVSHQNRGGRGHQEVEAAAEEHEALCREIDDAYERVREVTDVRTFSREVRGWWCGWVLLILRKQPFRSAREYLALCPSRDYWSLRSQRAASTSQAPSTG